LLIKLDKIHTMKYKNIGTLAKTALNQRKRDYENMI
jgi:hypothetical protein